MIECRCGMWVNPRYVIAVRSDGGDVKIYIPEGECATTDMEINVVLAMIAEVNS